MDGAHGARKADDSRLDYQGDQVGRAHEQVNRFAVQWFVDENPAKWANEFRAEMQSVIGVVDCEGLDDAAMTVLRDVHNHLVDARSPLERPIALKLARARASAIRALIYVHGEKRAKELLVSVASLTICTGHAQRVRLKGSHPRKVDTLAGELQFSVQGCGAVFPESTVASGNSMWASFCPDCQSEKKKPGRDQGRRLQRRIQTALLQPATVYVADADGKVSRRSAMY